MVSRAPAMLRAAGPLARATAGLGRPSTIRAAATSAATAALRQLDTGAARRPNRHPLSPAAVRIERAVSKREGERSELTAVTVWFGQGPSLPSAAGSDAMRTAFRLGTSVVGAAALAAMSVIAAHREERRTTIVDASPPLTIT